MNTLALLLEIEGGLLIIALLVLLVYEISVRHPNAFKLPVFKFPSFKLPIVPNSWLDKLRQDAQLIWKPVEPEFFTSPDGNTLYLSLKYTNNWLPYQVVLYMLSQKKEFLDQIQAKDPAAFEAVNELVAKLQKVQAIVSFQKMNILPNFQKNMLVWKLPLVDAQEKIGADVLVKELQTLQ